MEKLTLTVPAMFGDHHVTEVRRILLEMPGVQDAYASSCFKVVEVNFDPARLDADAIRTRLAEAGYTGELDIPAESGTSMYALEGRAGSIRHTAAYEQVGTVVSFAQDVINNGRPLWPCPGLGVVRQVESVER
jgi:copper chaperone CopZ